MRAYTSEIERCIAEQEELSAVSRDESKPASTRTAAWYGCIGWLTEEVLLRLEAQTASGAWRLISRAASDNGSDRP